MALGLVFVIVAVLTTVTGYSFPSVSIIPSLGNGDSAPLPSWPGLTRPSVAARRYDRWPTGWPAATNASQLMRGGITHAQAVDGITMLFLGMIVISLNGFHHNGRWKANACRR